MSKQVVWTKLIMETFIEEANLTKFEEMVLRTRCAGWSRTKQVMEFNVSMSTLDRTIKTLKRKYDAAQKTSLILPPRKNSEKELWMDTH